MRVFHFSPISDMQSSPELVKRLEREGAPATGYSDALALIRTELFDAFVIIDEIEEPEILECTASAQQDESERKGYLLSDSELPVALESLWTRENTDEAPN